MTQRDKFGRFCPYMSRDESERYNQVEEKIRIIEKQKKKQARLSWNESNLLYILVDSFKDAYGSCFENDSNDSIVRFKRKPYHEVFLSHRFSQKNLDENMKPNAIARAGFSRFIKRMEKNGWIKKIYHGRNLYLRITKKGFKKICNHDDFRKGII